MSPRIIPFVLFLLLTGCATWQVPGAGVAVGRLATDAVTEQQPAAGFPVRMVLAQLQPAGYAGTDSSCIGYGRYCVLTRRKLGTPEDLSRLRGMPLVADVTAMTQVSGMRFDGIDDLRGAAAGQQADILLLYSLDTRFKIGGNEFAPLETIRLALPPGQEGRVTATATAALVDVHNGFVYGVAETSAWRKRDAVAWSARKNIIAARDQVEREAFGLLLDEVERLWNGVVRTHGMRGTNVQ